MNNFTKDSNDTPDITSFEDETLTNVEGESLISIAPDNTVSNNIIETTTPHTGEKLTLDKSNPIPIFISTRWPIPSNAPDCTIGHYISTKSCDGKHQQIKFSLIYPNSQINQNVINSDSYLLTRDISQYCNVIKISHQDINNESCNIIGTNIFNDVCLHKYPDNNQLQLFHHKFCPHKGTDIKMGLDNSKQMIVFPIQMDAEKNKIPTIKMSIFYRQYYLIKPSLKNNYPDIYAKLKQNYDHILTFDNPKAETIMYLVSQLAYSIIRHNDLQSSKAEVIKNAMYNICALNYDCHLISKTIKTLIERHQIILSLFSSQITKFKKNLETDHKKGVVKNKLYDLINKCHDEITKQKKKEDKKENIDIDLKTYIKENIDEDIDVDIDEDIDVDIKEELQSYRLIIDSLIQNIKNLIKEHYSGEENGKSIATLEKDIPEVTLDYLKEEYIDSLKLTKDNYINNQTALNNKQKQQEDIAHEAICEIMKLIAKLEEDNIKLINIDSSKNPYKAPKQSSKKVIKTSDPSSANNNTKESNLYVNSFDAMIVDVAISLDTAAKFKIGTNIADKLMKNAYHHINSENYNGPKVLMLKNLDFNNFISAMKLPQDTNNPEQYTELLAQYSMPFQKKLSSKYICSSESTQVYDNEKLYYHKNNGCFTGLSALLASELHISNSAECTSTLSVPSQELYHNGTMLSII